MASFSVKLVYNKQKISKDGYSSLYFQVIIDSEKVPVKINLRWPVAFFDSEKDTILPRHKNDKDFHDYLMIIETVRADINEIFKFYRLSGKQITKEVFKEEILNTKSRQDFLVYWKTKIDEKLKNELISKQTYKNVNSSLNMLLKFKEQLPFKDLNNKTVEEFKLFVKKQKTNKGTKYKINTIAKFLTDFKFYLKTAKAEGILFEDPFENIKIATTKGSITFLDKHEILALWQYFHADTITESHRIVLRHFLFACFTGLRHSDLERITWKQIKKNNDMVFEPYKTRELQKIVIVPLCSNALYLIETKKGNLFTVYSNQKSNDILKEIAIICGIHKNLTTHVARHSFATQFLEKGGKLEVLKELMGHTKIETTMIYVHVTEEHKRNQIKLLDAFFDDENFKNVA